MAGEITTVSSGSVVFQKNQMQSIPNKVSTAEGNGPQEGVELTISKEAREKLEQTTSFSMEKQNWEELKEQGEVESKYIKDQGKILEIARRISQGGRVPHIDEKKLMEYSPKMYQMAKQAAMLAKQHKKYKEALFKEEDEKSLDKKEKIDALEQEKSGALVDIEMGEVELDSSSFEDSFEN